MTKRSSNDKCPAAKRQLKRSPGVRKQKETPMFCQTNKYPYIYAKVCTLVATFPDQKCSETNKKFPTGAIHKSQQSSLNMNTRETTGARICFAYNWSADGSQSTEGVWEDGSTRILSMWLGFVQLPTLGNLFADFVKITENSWCNGSS